MVDLFHRLANFIRPPRPPPIIEETAVAPEEAPTNLDPSLMQGRVFDLSKKEVARCDGFNLYAMPDDYVGKSIIDHGHYEAHVARVIAKQLREDSVFLDLGANVGFFTMMAASIAKNGKVISFEPNDQNLQLIYSSILLNGFKNITVFPYAASDAEGLLSFTLVGSNGGVVGGSNDLDPHHIYIQAKVLDDLLKDEKRIDIIKMDIEAHEPFAFRGMKKLVKKHRPKILTEFHPWAMRRNNIGDPENFLHDVINSGYRLSILPFEGEPIRASGAKDVMRYYESLNAETIQVDLFAEPLEAA